VGQRRSRVETIVRQTVERQEKPQFKVGDRVRLNKIHRTLKKAISPVGPKKCLLYIAWSRARCPPIRFANGMTPVQGTFYEADLQKIHVSDVFRIEKVLKRQKDRWLVKWKGWPDKYNSWIASQDVTSLCPPQKKKETSPPKKKKETSPPKRRRCD